MLKEDGCMFATGTKSVLTKHTRWVCDCELDFEKTILVVCSVTATN